MQTAICTLLELAPCGSGALAAMVFASYFSLDLDTGGVGYCDDRLGIADFVGEAMHFLFELLGIFCTHDGFSRFEFNFFAGVASNGAALFGNFATLLKPLG